MTGVQTCALPISPFEMVEKDGILYGRGVADDKGPLIAAYYAAKIVNELLPNPKLKMRIIFGCDEENGSSCMKYYFTKQPFPDMGFTPDADFPVVYGEKALAHYHLRGDIPQDNIIGIYGGVAANVVSEHCEAYVQGSYKQYKETFKAYLKEHSLNGSIEEEGNHTKFNIIGKAAHASTPDEGISAIVYLCHYLATISSNELVKFIDQYFYKDTHGKKLELMERGQMGVTTTNIGILHYKDGYVNSVVDFRLPHELSETELNSAISHAVQPLGLEIDYNYTPALFNDPKGEYIQTLHQAYVDLTGDTENQPQAIGGGTYAKTMPNCVAFGCQFPGKDHKMHQNDEEISIDDLIKACAIYAQAIYEIGRASCRERVCQYV